MRVHLCICGSGTVRGENRKFLCSMNLHVVESISVFGKTQNHMYVTKC